MEAIKTKPARRLGGVMALAGSLSAFSGTAFWTASGADLDQAHANDDITGNWLVKAGETSQLPVANLTIWIWLTCWSFLTAFAAVLNAIAMFTDGSGLSTYGFLIIPIGVSWMIAAGIVLLRGNDI